MTASTTPRPRRFAPLGPKLLSGVLWLEALAFAGWMLSFELGAAAAWATAVVSVAVIFRAAAIGVVATDDGVVIRNQWRTHRVPWSDVKRVFSKRLSLVNMQFVYVARRDGRPIRVWSSYARSRRDELLEVLRKRAKGRTDGLRPEDFRRNDSVVSIWKEARQRANLDPSSVAASRRMLLHHLGARIPFVLGASVLAGMQVAVVTLVAVTVAVGLLILTIRASGAPSPEIRGRKG